MTKRDVAAMNVVVTGALLGALTGCVAVAMPERTATPPDGVQVSAPVAGEVAVWDVAPGHRIDEGTTAVAVLVTRLGCNDGVTGAVNPPRVTVSPTDIAIAFTVSPLQTGAAGCPGNDQVEYVVELPEPLGDRPLIDEACVSTEAANTVYCETDVRFAPER